MPKPYSQTRLHPSVLAALKPYSAKASDFWRFSEHVAKLESKYLNRDLLLEEKVKFLLAILPEGLSVTGKRHLLQREREFLSDNSYTEFANFLPAAYDDTSELFWAPVCQTYFGYPEAEGGPDSNWSESTSIPELHYEFYKQLAIQFVSGDDGVSNCLATLKSLKQNSNDLRAHIGEFTSLLNRYCQLSNYDSAASSSLSLFTDFFYGSLDKELREALTDFPDDLEAAYSVATAASRLLQKRKRMETACSSNTHQSSLKRSATSSVHALQQAYADESVANLAQCFNETISDFDFVKTVASVCSLTPDLANIAQASKLEISGLRGSVDSVLKATPSYRHACNAIQNLTPSKFVKKTSSTRSEEAHYENLDELSTKDLKALYKKRQLIESLRSQRGGVLESLSSDDEDEKEDKQQRARPSTRSRRKETANVDVLEHACNVAFMQECFNHVDLCVAEQLCSKCRKPGHFFRSCPELKNTDGSFKPFCAFCKGEHMIQTCPKLLAIVCPTCKAKGHTMRFCPTIACSKCQGPHHASRCRQQ
jgi:hypothetical protein